MLVLWSLFCVLGLVLVLIGICLILDVIAEADYQQRCRDREREWDLGNQDPWH